MPLNDDTGDEFSTHLQDEHIFDAHPPPGIEMLGMHVKTDRGSGSYAEQGPVEVAEDTIMMDGEMPESSVMGQFAEEGASEIGDWSPEQGHMVGQAAVDGASEIGQYAAEGASEIGQYAEEGGSEIGQYAAEGASEIGQYAAEGASEIGALSDVSDWDKTSAYSSGALVRYFGTYYRAKQPIPSASFLWGNDDPDSSDAWSALTPAQAAALWSGSSVGDWSPEQGHMVGNSGGELSSDVIGSYAMYGPTEIGAEEVQAPFESFMLGPTGIGDDAPAAVAKVIEKARDNRQPPPPMKVVDADAPVEEDGADASLTEFLIGAAMATGKDVFPLTTQFMQRAGAGCPPRYVRVDSEESYQRFRTEQSAEMQQLSARVAELAARLDGHINDPEAHGGSGDAGFDDDLNADIQDLVILGQEVDQAEQDKRIDLWMPKRYQGLITAWREGGNVCASLMLPGKDGTVKVCTSLEPVVRCVTEMSKHAAESGAAETVVGHLPAMGCVLGAGTILKEVAAAAPAILDRPEAKGDAPFIVRIEPKVNPAISALAMLVMACRAGNQQACDEWEALGKVSPAPVRQAMQEALTLARAAA